MISKKALITGVSTLVLGVSVMGAAYAFPMNNISMQSSKPQAQMQTVSMQNNGRTPGTMPVNTMNQTAAGQAGSTTGANAPSGMSQTMPNNPASMPMSQQQMSQMAQNHQSVMQNNHQMAQNHQQMVQNQQAMIQYHQTMTGSGMQQGGMAGGHMGSK
ncbi:hypothetical protein Desca_2418 [Desulfotomaculum nigrificans CO-1-SRB]|uniref:Uncharacterized protein n=1 Tax=Desulfotomaculum nigrificans (strain DSM 14880 / VKM B-2319 / CO-1-SRB) TaxID=868595 RepID=F6B3T7_DESCC|nr:hypothetical protein [Desulfotomaculum nigrificans]AEF95246.1 hypothetical protein Desca_2418 [Desulfotomaculum nigrificans CO-1-SRB]